MFVVIRGVTYSDNHKEMKHTQRVGRNSVLSKIIIRRYRVLQIAMTYESSRGVGVCAMGRMASMKRHRQGQLKKPHASKSLPERKAVLTNRHAYYTTKHEKTTKCGISIHIPTHRASYLYDRAYLHCILD